jgi:hypothetical protein
MPDCFFPGHPECRFSGYPLQAGISISAHFLHFSKFFKESKKSVFSLPYPDCIKMSAYGAGFVMAGPPAMTMGW